MVRKLDDIRAATHAIRSDTVLEALASEFDDGIPGQLGRLDVAWHSARRRNGAPSQAKNEIQHRFSRKIIIDMIHKRTLNETSKHTRTAVRAGRGRSSVSSQHSARRTGHTGLRRALWVGFLPDTSRPHASESSDRSACPMTSSSFRVDRRAPIFEIMSRSDFMTSNVLNHYGKAAAPPSTPAILLACTTRWCGRGRARMPMVIEKKSRACSMRCCS